MKTFRNFFLFAASLALFSFVATSTSHAQAPVITSISPGSGPIGTLVVIAGAGFNANPNGNAVYFGTARATVLSATSSTLTVTVPSGATYEPVTVTTQNLTAFSAQPFSVTAAAPYNGITDASFSGTTNFPAGMYPYFVTSGDLDGDNKMDLVVLSINDNTMSLYRNIGSPGSLAFAQPVIYPAGATPFHAALGDMDGDGKLDIVIGSYGNSRIIIYKNEGSPGIIAMTNAKDFATGPNPHGIVIADFDGDGRADIGTANQNGNTASVFRNLSTTGNINIASQKDFPVGYWPQRLSAGDYDGDGKPDLAVPNYNSGLLSVLRNTGSQGMVSFASKIDFSAGGTPFHASTGDLDGDGKDDIVVSNVGSNNIRILKNNSTAGKIDFSEYYDLYAGNTPVFSTLGDLDGDGKIDIIVANFGANTLSLFRNIGSKGIIAFDAKRDFKTGTSPRAASIADLTGDGQPDISFISSNSNTLSVLANNMREVPLIQSFNPAAAESNTLVTINGSGLTGTTAVFLGGVPVKNFTASAISIQAIVGDGATGDVVVTTSKGSAVAPGFTFLKFGQPTFRNDQTIVLDASCGMNDGNISIIPLTGTAPFLYSINGGADYVEGPAIGYTFTGLSAGIYQLRLKDASGTESVLVSREIKKVFGQPTFRNDQTIVLDASCGMNDGNISIIPTCGTPPFLYSINAGLSYVSGPDAGFTFQSLAPGRYQLRLKDAMGNESAIVEREIRADVYGNCDKEALTFSTAFQTSPNSKAVELVVFPNPSHGKFRLQLNRFASPEARVQVLDSHGALLQNRIVNATETNGVEIDLTRKAKGLYIIRVSSEKGVKVAKVLVQ
ncbi:FG-GAP-like repeat-containing protein [Flavisolibacter nicotianae]|uniref:FG-GAP-like repeat-containing protein n=1 Tax=Flavisolibacter nicotianae TaxID=2364882 RepID=UPI0013C4F5A2|nr:FG-GAP-like repeat-containing protein [Flavisolibacter nicotianae]